jgi:hypothetical protein
MAELALRHCNKSRQPGVAVQWERRCSPIPSTSPHDFGSDGACETIVTDRAHAHHHWRAWRIRRERVENSSQASCPATHADAVSTRVCATTVLLRATRQSDLAARGLLATTVGPTRCRAGDRLAACRHVNAQAKCLHEHFNIAQRHIDLDAQKTLDRGQWQPTGLGDLVGIGPLPLGGILERGKDSGRFWNWNRHEQNNRERLKFSYGFIFGCACAVQPLRSSDEILDVACDRTTTTRASVLSRWPGQKPIQPWHAISLTNRHHRPSAYRSPLRAPVDVHGEYTIVHLDRQQLHCES